MSDRSPPALLFVCGGLEPGRDGVGDYTRLLGAAMQERGARVGLLAWKDSHIHAPRAECTPEGIPVVRLPEHSHGSGEMTLVHALLERVKPDVVSLQFVPFSYHPKGYVGALAQELKGVFPSLPWQVMVHEPWSDGGRGGFLRRLAVTTVQRHGTKALLRGLRPLAVHTSNARYAALLAKAGIRSEVLPLFGNIPVTGRRDPVAFERLLAAAGVEERAPGQVPLHVGLFGTLHAEWEPEPAAADLAAAARAAGRAVRLVGVGSFGPAGDSLWRRLEAALGVRGVSFGRRQDGEVSMILANLDLAFASTPWEMIGKSGSCAALLEHGTPVIVSRGDGRRESELEGLHFFTGNWGRRWLEVAALRPKVGSRLPAVADAFVASLAAVRR